MHKAQEKNDWEVIESWANQIAEHSKTLFFNFDLLQRNRRRNSSDDSSGDSDPLAEEKKGTSVESKPPTTMENPATITPNVIDGLLGHSFISSLTTTPSLQDDKSPHEQLPSTNSTP
jgi:hypothetical protein